ncbi:peptide ABC transporter substrate-binding protein [Lentilactobacillus raoultii]|uniref:Peptide ABC transporter substrate-binding protein n=1 Tax=Lentilactobacillus raoultii TaxID=1987503 RepID=A0ABW3PM52_9LACO|nr:peptide ABC transporter substrate-binding protein [Lentilactobacillus raoultii]
MKKTFTYSLLLATSVLLLSACSTKSSQNSGTKQKALNVTIGMEPSTADPNKDTDVYSASMINQTLEGLYHTTNSGKVVPGVATRVVKPTNSNTTYVFNLRKNAKWQNGQPVTAQDFVTSFDRQVNPKTKSQYANRFTSFKNYTAIQKGAKDPTALGVKALGKYKLQINLSAPDPDFNFKAANEYYPINTNAVKKWGSKYGTSSKKTVSNGPFTLQNWDPSKGTWTYKKNKNYWDAKDVKLPKVKVQVVKDPSTAQNLFASNKVQETVISGGFVKADAHQFKKNLVYTKKGQMRFLNFSTKNKVTNNRNFRLAVSYALDRNQLTKNILEDGSTPAKSLVPEGEQTDPANGKDFNSELKQTLTHNKQMAQSYWKKAQKQLGTKKVTVNLLTEDDSDQKKLSEYIQSAVQSTLNGVKMTLTSVPQQQQLSRMFGGKYQITALGWSTDFPDPSDYLNLMTKSNTVNFTHWTNSNYEKLMSKVNNTAKYTGERRWKLMVKAGNLAMKQQPVVPTYQDTEVHLVSSKIGGLKYSLLTDSQYRYAYWK